MERRNRIRLVRDPLSGVEAIHARFLGHAYDMHQHDEWLVGITDHGVQDFFCRGKRQRSTPGRVILIEPGEMHDGQAITPEGFAYSMLYIPQTWLQARLGERSQPQPGFRTTLADDRRLAPAIRRACDLLAGPAQSHEAEGNKAQGDPSSRLARDAALDAVLRGLQAHFGYPDAPVRQERSPSIARRARDFLHARIADDVGADELARLAGAADRFHLARAFRAAYGTSPHAYLVQVRLSEARRRLKAGGRPANVAAACGFADQSHLGRWFRRAYGMTPSDYRAGCTGVPDIRFRPE